MKPETAQEVYHLYGYCCAYCRRPQDLQIHHKEHKAMGGRHGIAKQRSESVKNLILLCDVCHGAQHGERIIKTDGFSCDTCWYHPLCEFSQARKEYGESLPV